jgi:RIO kinase 1
VYRDLLADKSKATTSSNQVGSRAQPEEEDESDQSGGVSISDGSDESVEGSDDEDPFAKKPPRGKKHEDKESKRQHKQKVKEEKREQRAKKIPKHVKKKIVNSTKRK